MDYSLQEGQTDRMQTHPEEYLDEKYWNLENENFEIIDWAKWYKTNPEVPKVFDPPQKNNLKGLKSAPMWWWNRSCYFKPVPSVLQCCCAIKPEMERISDGDTIFRKMLDPRTTSDDAPDEFKNHLFWTENNIAPETLINFGSWAWRKQTNGGRTIGVGKIQDNWTSDPTCFGYFFSLGAKKRVAVVQRSPDGKWFALSTTASPSPEASCNWLFIYVVQKDDKFTTTSGEDMDHVKPGDLVRVSWGGTNPYETDNSKLSYFYFPRRVASTNKEGILVKNSPHYEDLLKAATNDASDKCCETCCYTCTLTMSPEERFNFQVNHISDKQAFKIPAAPPTSEVIDRELGEDSKLLA